MRRKLIGRAVGVALCLALALVPYLTDVRGAGYYATAGAFAGGLVLGFYAIGVELATFAVLATILYIDARTHPNLSDQSPIIIFPIMALFAMYFAVPTLAGAVVRLGVATAIRRGRRAPRTPGAQAPDRP
jgi:hypothetical protein